MRKRAATIFVQVPESWLTADGEEREEDGWNELSSQINAALVSINSSRWGYDAQSPAVTFIEWLDGCELCGEATNDGKNHDHCVAYEALADRR